MEFWHVKVVAKSVHTKKNGKTSVFCMLQLKFMNSLQFWTTLDNLRQFWKKINLCYVTVLKAKAPVHKTTHYNKSSQSNTHLITETAHFSDIRALFVPQGGSVLKILNTDVI